MFFFSRRRTRVLSLAMLCSRVLRICAAREPTLAPGSLKPTSSSRRSAWPALCAFAHWCACADRAQEARGDGASPGNSRDPSSADIHGDVAAKIAFHDIVAIDDLADLDDLRFGQLADAPLWRNGDLGANLLGEGVANPMDISQSHLDPLVGRDVHACYSGHVVVSSCTANVLKPNPE